MSDPQLTFKSADKLNTASIEDLICGYAGNICFEGSLLRECTIADRTSCEYFNDPAIAPKCFVKTHHENYQKEIAELLKNNKIKDVRSKV